MFRNEFFLGDYIYKLANFDNAMLQSGFTTEGYFDNFNMNADKLKEEIFNIKKRRKWGRHEQGQTIRYEFAFSPNAGFLASPDLLLKDTELKISFDRCPPSMALLEVDTITTECIKLEIKDCFAMTEYVSSEALRESFATIENIPYVYEFEEVDVMIKNLPLNETDIRFDNIRGGKLPTHMFIGLISQSALKGSFDLSSTCFEAENISELNITLNGNSVHGYPMTIKNNSAIYPIQKFFETTNSMYNESCGSCLTLIDFDYNFIHSHLFEGETSNNGWIGVNFKLTKAPTKPMSIVLWFITQNSLSIDKFHSVERINY